MGATSQKAHVKLHDRKMCLLTAYVKRHRNILGKGAAPKVPSADLAYARVRARMVA